MHKVFKPFLSTAIVVAGMAALSVLSTPASAFWVGNDEINYIGNIFEIPEDLRATDKTVRALAEGGSKENPSENARVFLNEVDPDYRYDGVGAPTRSKFEIAAPNTTNLAGWKFQTLEAYPVYRLGRPLQWYTTIIDEVDFSNSPQFTSTMFEDQQQGWGFKSFETRAPAAYGYLLGWKKQLAYRWVTPQAQYVLAKPTDDPNRIAKFNCGSRIGDDPSKWEWYDKNHYPKNADQSRECYDVVQALGYRDTITISSPSSPAYDMHTISILGRAPFNRKGWYTFGKYQKQEGSWKFNNVNMTPTSTYGQLQNVQGVDGAKYNPKGLHWDNQWDVGRIGRQDTPSDASVQPSSWGGINFVHEDWLRDELFSLGLNGGHTITGQTLNKWWGPSFFTQKGDEGYYFDVDGVGHGVMNPIANRIGAQATEVGKDLSIPVVTLPGLPNAPSNPDMRQLLRSLGVTNQTYGQMFIDAATDAKQNFTIQPALPEGVRFNSETGVIEGKLSKDMPRTLFTIAVKNPRFDSEIKTGYNGHGITYRTFLWESSPATTPVKPNEPPVITVEPIIFKEGQVGVAHGTVADPENDKIVSKVLSGVQPADVPGDLIIQGEGNNFTISTKGNVSAGTYVVRISVTDEKGSVAHKEVTVLVRPRTKPITIGTDDLIAEYGQRASVPVTVSSPIDEETGKPYQVVISVKPNDTVVPPGLYTKVVNGELRLLTDGSTPVGDYSILVTGQVKIKGITVEDNGATGTKQDPSAGNAHESDLPAAGTKAVNVRILSSKLGLRFTNHTIDKGTAFKDGAKPALPIQILGEDQPQTMIRVHGLDVNQHDFILVNERTANPSIVVNKQVNAGTYIIEIQTVNPNKPGDRLLDYMKVRVIAGNPGPVIATKVVTVKTDGRSTTANPLDIYDPLGGAVNIGIMNPEKLPKGIYLEDGNMMVAGNVKPDSYRVDIQAADARGEKTLGFITVSVIEKK